MKKTNTSVGLGDRHIKEKGAAKNVCRTKGSCTYLTNLCFYNENTCLLSLEHRVCTFFIHDLFKHVSMMNHTVGFKMHHTRVRKIDMLNILAKDGCDIKRIK